MKMFRKDEGFTLIELMVVVLIIGILVAIAIPVFNSAKANAQTKACFANERTVEGAAHTYEASTGNMPGSGWTTLTGLLVGSYLVKEPQCPIEGNRPYTWDGSVINCAGTTGHGHY